MNAKQPSNFRLRAAVSVSQMAKLVDLSRASFYAYIKRGIFLAPIYSVVNHRPLFTAEMQAENLAVRESAVGVNGQYVLFYEKRQAPAAAKALPKKSQHDGLMASLKSLGLDKITAAQVDEAIASNFPNGIADVDEAVVLRTLNRHLRRLGHG
jgi:hypothetical protein